MTIEEKTAIVLHRLAQYKLQHVIHVTNLLDDLDPTVEEVKEILKRLEFEGYATSDQLQYGQLLLTPLGKKVGMHDMYLELHNQRVTEARKLRRNQFWTSSGKVIDRAVTYVTGIGTLCVLYWGTSLNTDMKDVKVAIDSVSIEIKALKIALLEAEKLRDSKPLPPVTPVKSTSDTLGRSQK
ncbi:hypothetical protein IC229_05910 [Spirosoma sp. BT702]|uniref:Uncharacterized protein n=1 Tax=Spirosoma profusum TaxID=2771354 RepID=A0A926Y1K2_9BACT|nr:hypothetical protein [Spirosoma profusum]MBD2700161.1 hypothetical protein [Spirosoma profusum]